MKFWMNGTDLKNTISRVSCVIPKKPALPMLGSIRIQANADGSVLFSATDVDDFLTVAVTTKVEEPGVVWVLLSDIKKVLTIKDDVAVSATGNTFTVKNGRKNHQVRCYDSNEAWCEPKKMKMKNVLAINDKELVSRLSKVDCMRNMYANGDNLLSGFYFDLKTEDDGRIVTCDSYRIGISGGISQLASTEFITSEKFYAMMKAIVAKNDSPVVVSINDKRTWLSLFGKDYIFITKLIEGQYFDYRRSSEFKGDVEYVLDSKEVSKIFKEYKALNKDEKLPLVMYGFENYLGFGIKASDYRTCDILENVIVAKKPKNDGYYACFNPQYLLEASEMFNGTMSFISDGSWKTPIAFVEGSNKAIVLPVNTGGFIDSDPMVSYIREQILG